MRRKPTAEASAEADAAESVERRAGAKGNTHQQSTYWAQNQARVTKALERIRQLRRHTPEVGAVCGKAARTVLCGGRDENHVPTATEAARVHDAAWGRGGRVADGSAGAAVAQAADHRLLGVGHIVGQEPLGRRFCAAAA